MIKAMIFIDGTWLYNNRRILRNKYGKPDFQIDYGKLPRALASELAHRMGISDKDVDVVRTYLFGSAPWNFDMRDDDIVQKQLRFYEVLREDYHYEVEIFRIDFRGGSVRRDENDPHPHKHAEKCVDVALATSMLYFAAIPQVYDIAVAVVGDRDYVPALQHIRRLGRRVAIASIEESCHKDYKDPLDRQRVKDFDIIYLSSMLDRLELSYQMQRLRCDSPLHVGDRIVWDSYRPRKGEKFYCRDCRARFAEQRKKDFEAAGLIGDIPTVIMTADTDVAIPRSMTGVVKFIPEGKRYGFITAADQKDYFFHETDLVKGLEWEQVRAGMKVVFEVKKPAVEGHNGAACHVVPQDQGIPQNSLDANGDKFSYF